MSRAISRGPLWLMTLADLALLLVGCFALLQATSRLGEKDRTQIVAGLRSAFGGSELQMEEEASVAVGINRVGGFAPGSDQSSGDHAALIDWVRANMTDGRTLLDIIGHADGSAADRIDGSAVSLAARRAATVAAMIERSGALPRDRLLITVDMPAEDRPADASRRRVDIRIIYARPDGA
jgi:flagellar motor protein MotB